jgi:hypothetical protein
MKMKFCAKEKKGKDSDEFHANEKIHTNQKRKF